MNSRTINFCLAILGIVLPSPALFLELEEDLTEIPVLEVDLSSSHHRVATGRKLVGSSCEYVGLCNISDISGCDHGDKFVIKPATGVRKQFLILNGNAVLAFVANQMKFVNCSSFTEVTTNIKCKEVAGAANIDLNKKEGIEYPVVDFTHHAHEAFGKAQLLSNTSISLTHLFYDGAGPKTNWIVGTKSPIGVDSNTYIIDQLAENGEVLYTATDLSSSVPSLPSFNNFSTELSLPVLDGVQLTWEDVTWLALWCRQVNMLFMDVTTQQLLNIPEQ